MRNDNIPDSANPSSPDKPLPWRVLAGLLVLMLIALAPRLYHLQRESVSLEEYACIAYLDAPNVAKLLELQRWNYPFGAPLTPVMQYFWAAAFGNTIFAVRMLSVVAGMLLIPMMYLFARVFFGNTEQARRAGYIAAMCAALSHVQVFHSQEARMYAFFALFAAASVCTLIQAGRKDRPAWWALHLAANFLVIWVHLFGLVLLFFEGLWLLMRYRGQFRRILFWFAAHAVFCIPLAVWVITIPEQPNHLFNWYQPPDQYAIIKDIFADDVVAWASLGLRPSPHAWEGWPAFSVPILKSIQTEMNAALAGLMLAAAIGLTIAAIRARKKPAASPQCKDGAPDAGEFGLLLLVFWGPMLLLIALSYLGKPCYSSRYTVYAPLILYLGLAGAIAAISRPVIRNAIFGGICFLYAYQLSIGLPGPMRMDWNPAIARIAAESTPSDVVLIEDPFWTPIFRFNGRELRTPISDAFSRQTLCDLAAFYVQQPNTYENSDGPRPGSWILLVDVYNQGGAMLEDCLKTRGLQYKGEKFPGEQTLWLYHVTNNTPVPSHDLRTPDSPLLTLTQAIGQQPLIPALERFRDANRMPPDYYGSPYIRMGWALAEKGLYGPAAVAWEKAQTINPEYAIQFVDLRVAVTASGDRKSYEMNLDAADSPLAWRTRGILRILDRDYPAAIPPLLRAAEAEPENPLGHWLLWRAFREANQEAEAQTHILKAFQIDPLLPVAWSPVFSPLYIEQDYPAAARIIQDFQKKGLVFSSEILNKLAQGLPAPS